MSSSPSTARRRPAPPPAWLLGAYGLLLVYLSLYPFIGWARPEPEVWDPLLGNYPFWHTWEDLTSNFILYVPVGALLTWTFSSRMRRRWATPLAVITGALLSLTFEVCQGFLPSRVPTILDVACNSAGVLAGSVVTALAWPWLTRRSMDFSPELRPHPLTGLSLLTPPLWGLAQLTPLVPGTTRETILAGWEPLARVVQNPALFVGRPAVAFGLLVLGLGLLVSTVAEGPRTRRRLLGWYAVFVLLVLAAKVLVDGRQLSAEALVGATGALVLLPLLVWVLEVRARAVAAFTIFAAVVVLQGLRPTPGWLSGENLETFNWIPFKSHRSTVGGLGQLLSRAWPHLGMGCVAYRLTDRPNRRMMAFLGGTMLAVLVLSLSTFQDQDLEAPLGAAGAALIAWAAPWWVGRTHRGRRPPSPEAQRAPASPAAPATPAKASHQASRTRSAE